MKSKRDFSRYSSRILLGVIIGLILSVSIFGAINYPRPTPYKYLNDYVGIIDRQSAQRIITLGREIEQKTGAQAVIVIINSLEDRPIEEYANGLFRTWGIGQGNKDNGLLILLAMQDQRWRVEVGRGLEGAIPDVLSNRIMQQLALPEFEEGYYGQGLAQAYSQFGDEIANEYGVTLTHSLGTSILMQEATTNRSSAGLMGYGIILAILFIDLIFNGGRLLRFLFLSSLFSGHRNGRGGGGGFGGFGGGSSNGGGSSGSW